MEGRGSDASGGVAGNLRSHLIALTVRQEPSRPCPLPHTWGVRGGEARSWGTREKLWAPSGASAPLQTGGQRDWVTPAL